MQVKMIVAGLAGLLVAGGAFAGKGKSTTVTTGAGGSSHVVITSGDDDGVRVILNGEGSGNVTFFSDEDGKGAKTLRMQSNDGRMVFETEPDADRAWLGVLLSFTDVGVEVDSVMEGSPAAEAGFEVGDLILSVDGRDMSKARDRGGLLDGKDPGDRARFTVLRDGKEATLRVRLGSHPGRVEFEVDEDMGAFGMAGGVLESLGSLKSLDSLKGLESLKGLSVLPFFDCDDDEEDCPPTFLSLTGRSKPRLGVVLETLSPQLAEFFEVKAGEGMLIKEVVVGSLAERTGLLAGDVLVKIDDTEIDSLSDVRDSLKGVGKGQAVRLEVVRRGVRESFRAELDTDPNPGGGYSFSFGSNQAPRSEGDQGALESLQRAVELAREARASADANRAEDMQARQLAERRALEDAAVLAREKRQAGSSKRTF